MPGADCEADRCVQYVDGIRTAAHNTHQLNQKLEQHF